MTTVGISNQRERWTTRALRQEQGCRAFLRNTSYTIYFIDIIVKKKASASQFLLPTNKDV